MNETLTETSISLSFDDNSLLPALFGEYGSHLTRIEEVFGVSADSRGEVVAITGDTASVEQARSVMECLYDRLAKGEEIGVNDVDAVIRMVRANEGTADEARENVFRNRDLQIRTRNKVITPFSNGQAEYFRALRDNELVFALGPAGTGKTYLAVAMAVSMFLDHKVDRIILSRPAVEAGERLGFLPGDLKEKVDPYMRPIYDALMDMLPPEKLPLLLETGQIEIAPLAFMRGRTLSNAFVILDEAQNTTPTQMKMFLTRLGEYSRMAVTGDLSQIDLLGEGMSGLRDAVERLEGIEGIGCVRFSKTDIVRHPLAARIVEAYESDDSRKHG